MKTDTVACVELNIKELREQDPDGVYHFTKTGESADGRKWISMDNSEWYEKSYAIKKCQEEIDAMAAGLAWKRGQIKVMRAM